MVRNLVAYVRAVTAALNSSEIEVSFLLLPQLGEMKHRFLIQEFDEARSLT